MLVYWKAATFIHFETMDDKNLIKEYLEGNEKAFAQLLKRYLSILYNFIFQMVRNKAAAEDIVQETFIKVWKHLSRFDQNKSFKPWIFAIAKNTAYDYLKKKKTIPFSSFEDSDERNILEETVSGDALLPDAILERKEIVQELEKALENIPELYRTLLFLAYREDFSLREISEILGEPYNTVKSRYNRAIERLKKAILMRDASDNSFHT